MRFFLFFCCNFLFINKIQASLEGDCYVEGVEDSHWISGYHNEPIDDFEESEFKRFKIKNIKSVEVFGDHYGKYFNVKIQNKRLLIIFPTEEFKDVEMKENSTEDPEMVVTFKFKCKTGERVLLFYQPIRDSNTYPPEFDNPEFTYHLPMPLPAGFDIDGFGPEMVACDIDISNVRVQFANSAAEDFLISWKAATSERNKCHKAVVTTLNPLWLLDKKVYEIVVTDIGIPPLTTSANLIIEINEENSLPSSPEFEQAYYIGSYHYSKDGKHSLHLDNPIRLKEGCSNVQLEVLDYKDTFKVDCDSNEVLVKLIGNLDTDLLEKNRAVVVTIQATTVYVEDPDRTVLEIYITRDVLEEDHCAKECPPCSTDLNCTTTTKPPAPASLINFLKDLYEFERRFGYIGYVGAVSVVTSPVEDVEYTFTPVSDISDGVECDKKTGVFKLTKQLPPKTYKLTVYARGLITNVETETTVNITISLYHSAKGSILSMLVAHVSEEMKERIELPCPYESCNYSIIEQYPETNHIHRMIVKYRENLLTPTCGDIQYGVQDGRLCKEHYEFLLLGSYDISNYMFFGMYNSKRSNFIKCPKKYSAKFGISICNATTICMDIGIDREGIEVPQLTLSLTVTILESKRRKRDTKDIESREWLRVSPETLHIMDGLIVLLVIDDINDNPPVFEVGRKLVIGYPHKTLNSIPIPPYLVKVSATDLDGGENATIRYSTESSRFVVNPTTGMVYANKQSFGNESSLMFYVTATDRDGADDGLSTHLAIEVKLLKEEHIVNIIVNNITLEDVDFFVEKLSNNTENMTVKYLTAIVIPICYCNNAIAEPGNSSLNVSTEEEHELLIFPPEPGDISTEFEDIAEESGNSSSIPPVLEEEEEEGEVCLNYSVRMFIYALDADDELVEVSQLKEALEDSGLLEEFEIEYEFEMKGFLFDYQDEEEEDDLSDCILIDSVLVLLLACFSLAIGVLYYSKVYKYNEKVGDLICRSGKHH